MMSRSPSSCATSFYPQVSTLPARTTSPRPPTAAPPTIVPRQPSFLPTTPFLPIPHLRLRPSIHFTNEDDSLPSPSPSLERPERDTPAAGDALRRDDLELNSDAAPETVEQLTQGIRVVEGPAWRCRRASS